MSFKRKTKTDKPNTVKKNICLWRMVRGLLTICGDLNESLSWAVMMEMWPPGDGVAWGMLWNFREVALHCRKFITRRAGYESYTSCLHFQFVLSASYSWMESSILVSRSISLWTLCSCIIDWNYKSRYTFSSLSCFGPNLLWQQQKSNCKPVVKDPALCELLSLLFTSVVES